MKKLFNLLLLSFVCLAAQAQDPQISSPSVSPSPGLVGAPVTLSVDFFNASSVAITNPDPVNGPTQVTFSCIKFVPTGGATPTVSGPGSVYFNWTAIGSNGTWSIIGKQKPGVTIPGSSGFPPTYAGGKISIPGIIYAASTSAQATANNGDGFNANIIPGDGGDINTGSGSNNQSSYGYTNGALPLTLLDFNVTKNGTQANLAWTTGTEQNTAYFGIERSGDGNTFSGIGRVAAAGTSNNNRGYKYTDATPLTGTNYYRLKLADTDGNFTYSPVRVVSFGSTALTAISIYPVPVIDVVNIKGVPLNAVITILNSTGQLVISKKATSAIENIPLQHHANGIYIVRITENNTVVYTQQFVKGS